MKDIREINNFFTSKNFCNMYTNVILQIAKKAADLTIGEGILFSTPSVEIQDFLDRWSGEQHISTKLWKWAYQMSIVGRGHLWLSRNEKGELDLLLTSPIANTRVSMYNEKEVAASIYTSMNQGDKGFFYKIDFYSDRMKITKYVSDETTRINDVETRVPENSVLLSEQEFLTGIDMIPLIEVTNLPKPNLYPQNTFHVHPDWEPVINLILDEQDIIKQKRKERRKNQTWFNGVLTPELMKSIMDSGQDTISALQDGLIQNNGNNYTKGQTNGFEITLGNPPLEAYNQDWLFTEIQIYNGCGYNHPREGENASYTNRAQTLVNGVLDEQTTRVKQRYWKTKLYQLFDYLIIDKGFWDGIGPRPYDFKFKSIGLSDLLQKDQIINSRLENGTMSRSQAIQEYEGITESNAKKELEAIQDELDEYPTPEQKLQEQKEKNSAGEPMSKNMKVEKDTI